MVDTKLGLAEHISAHSDVLVSSAAFDACRSFSPHSCVSCLTHRHAAFDRRSSFSVHRVDYMDSTPSMGEFKNQPKVQFRQIIV